MDKKFILFFLLLTSATNSFAHLSSGEDKIIEPYLVDFGYSPKNLNTIEPTFLNFNLVNETTKTPILYSSVWISISNVNNKNQNLFSAILYPEVGNSNLQILFQKGGNYNITAQFRDKKSKKILSTSFKIEVKNKNNNEENIFILFIKKIIQILF